MRDGKKGEIMQLAEKKTIIIAAVGFFTVGLLVGWLAIGWWLWPVTYYDADPFDLRARHKVAYVTMVADSYALTHDVQLARQRLEGWPEEELATLLSDLTTEYMKQGRGTEVQRVTALATDLGISMPLFPLPATEVEEKPAGKGGLGTFFAICGVIVAIVALIAGGALVWSYLQKRKGGQFGKPMPAPDVAREPVRPQEPTGPFSYGTFLTSYNIGDDSYDDCFPIETASGEFLGECGLGISEVLHDGEPSLVTAFEVWLFDKSDIRTVTKVLMSEHAFANDELRERLAPKGEAVLAEPGKTITLETAALMVQAEIKEMAYGAGEGPDQSHFARLTVELVASAKEPESGEDVAF